MTWLCEAFLQILSMSVLAGAVVVVVLFARILLRRAPKLFCYMLWGVVLFRLLCPVSFTSPLSMFGVPEQIQTRVAVWSEGQADYGKIVADAAALTGGNAKIAEEGGTALWGTAGTDGGAAGAAGMDGGVAAGAWQDDGGRGAQGQANVRLLESPIVRAASILWVIGMAALLVHNSVSFLNLRKRLSSAVRIRNNLYETDQIGTPFVLGIARPRIYLPTTLTEQETDYIVMHERTHIRRQDHIIKLLSFLALVLHWFNPLVWLASALAERDMEMSCDEAVMRHMDGDIREEYSRSLLSFAVGGRRIAGAPLAFGESDTKARIRNIMRYKKPAGAGVAAALFLVILLAASLGSDPKETNASAAENGVNEDGAEDGAQDGGLASALSGTETESQEGEAAKPAEAFTEQWAKAFCNRNGAAIASMSSENLAESFAEEGILLGIFSEESGSYDFGWSSPWPWSEDTDFSVEEATDYGAVIFYYAQVSDPHVTVWREELAYSKEGEDYLVNAESLTFYDAVSMGAEYEDAYPHGITGTGMDYIANGMGEVLNENAKRTGGAFYEELFEPESAARYLLNLLKNERKVELTAGGPEENGSVPVKIRFLEDDKSYMVSMIQPYGEDGIWIPQTYGAWDEAGMAAGGSKTAGGSASAAGAYGLAGGNDGAADDNAQRELAVRSVSRSFYGIDSYVPDGEFDGEPLVFADDCLFRVNMGMSQPKYEVVDFDTFADYISEGEAVINKPCSIVYDGEQITEISLLSGYYRYGIFLNNWVTDYDEYEMQKEAVAQAEGKAVSAVDLLGNYYTLDYTSAIESSLISDVSDAEGIERIDVYTGNIGDGDSGYVMLYGADGGTFLHNEFAHTARAGWKSVYMGSSDGQSWLMTLHIEDRDTYGSYDYQVFRLDEDGKVQLLAGSSFCFGEDYIYDDELFWQWAKELEGYLDNSTLLLSTQDGEVRTEHVSEGDKYNYETLHR